VRRAATSPGLVFSGGFDSTAIAGLAGPVVSRRGQHLIAAASVMPADYRGSIRHARRWVEMCARDMPHLDVHYVTRDGSSVLSDLERCFLEKGLPSGSNAFVLRELLSTIAQRGARVVMDGHGGDYTLDPRGQAALARLLLQGRVVRFAAEFRHHGRMTGEHPLSTLAAIALQLAPERMLAAARRVRHRHMPPWGDRPVNAEFARRVLGGRGAGGTLRGGRTRRSFDMRGRMLQALRTVCSGASSSIASLAATHRLELTRPFHDKRVVELALAIPEDLYVKNGRSRYLACAALRDIYPREFQSRSRLNDHAAPDFQRIVKSLEPQLLAELSRMEQSRELASYFDFAKIRGLLAARGADDHNSGWEQDTQMAISGFLAARYIEWFHGWNRTS